MLGFKLNYVSKRGPLVTSCSTSTGACQIDQMHQIIPQLWTWAEPTDPIKLHREVLYPPYNLHTVCCALFCYGYIISSCIFFPRCNFIHHDVAYLQAKMIPMNLIWIEMAQWLLSYSSLQSLGWTNRRMDGWRQFYSPPFVSERGGGYKSHVLHLSSHQHSEAHYKMKTCQSVCATSTLFFPNDYHFIQFTALWYLLYQTGTTPSMLWVTMS